MSSSMAHDSMMAEMGMTMDMPWTATDVFFHVRCGRDDVVGMMTGTPHAAPLRGSMPHAGRAACRRP
jgi:hypothetical protein